MKASRLCLRNLLSACLRARLGNQSTTAPLRNRYRAATVRERYKLPAFLLLAALLSPAAVVLDRVAVIVGKQVIKTSDIERDLRLTEFLNREKVDLSVAARRKAAERLIDQSIIRNELANGGYSRPSAAEVHTLLQQLRRDRFSGSEARMNSALASYGLNAGQLQAQLVWQLTVLRFIDQRFRPAVLVTDEEVRAYYDQHLDELRKEKPGANTFEALEPEIRRSLEGERINQSFTQWLENARKRNHIEYREGAFQ